jgi:DNA-binding PucR family transcriptional regulator
VRLGVGFQLLSVLRDKETVWAWLGSARPLCATELEGAWARSELARTSLALGEPGHGVEGWRLTHRQAQAAQWVALQRPGELTRYADELLLVAALKDEVLASSLRETYLSPLKDRGECNGLAATTLRAYFTSGCNAATAAAALRVDRHTVQRRLQRIEERLGRSIHDCRAELEVALRLEEFTQAGNGGDSETPSTGPELAASPVGSPAQ